MWKLGDAVPAPAPKPRRHFALIDSMRGLAALSVVAYHVTFHFAYPSSGLWQLLSQRAAGPPVTAVVVFFLISGFVLYRPFVAARFDAAPLPSLMPYAVRRVARIAPAYWVALAITALLLDQRYVFTAHGLVTYFGFLQLYGKPSTINGGISPAWTLCVEVTFYAVLPLLAVAARRIGRRRSPLRAEFWLCAALAGISLVWQGAILAVASPSSTRIFGLLLTLPGSLDLFAAGMALAAASVALQRGQLAVRWARLLGGPTWPYWLGAGGLLYAAGQLGGLYSSDGLAGWWVPTHELKALAAALLLAPLVFGDRRRGLIKRVLGWRAMLWLGAVSYGIYLWHQPLLDKLAPHLAHSGEIVMMVVIAAASVAVAALSFYLVERPAQRLARLWLRPRERRARAVGSRAAPVDPVGAIVESPRQRR